MTSSTRKRTKQTLEAAEPAPVNGHAAGPALGSAEEEEKKVAGGGAKADAGFSIRDRNAIVLLVILCKYCRDRHALVACLIRVLTEPPARYAPPLTPTDLLQGVPVGLAFGTMPYLLKTKLSYADIGTFMLATYPYSLKLAWSPIVDSCWVKQVTLPLLGRVGLGRRKSWIVPIQFIVGLMLWFLGGRVDQLLLNDKPPVLVITALFFTLVTFAATQDIAVDGWALTLLSQDNLSYASTAQTVGLNIGYFMSFTVFLALNSVEFSNKYLRSAANAQDSPVLSLSAYLRIAAAAFILVTLWLAFFKEEDDEEETAGSDGSAEENLGLRGAYEVMFKICKLKHVQKFLMILLVAKIGFQANEAVTGLKLVEKGFSKEDLALTVLIDFPFQIILGYLAARWSRGDKALTPWLWGYGARLVFAVVSMGIVAGLPGSGGSSPAPIGLAYFGLIILSTVAGSFASTVQFVGISAFNTQIADPLIGGTYMTLLNTVSNLGGTWPSYFVLKAVDLFTASECRVSPASLEEHAAAHARPGLAGERAAAAAEALLDHLKEAKTKAEASAAEYVLLPAGGQCATLDAAKQACRSAGGACHTTRDGYYATSSACVLIGLVLLFAFILPQSRKLEKMDVESWRLGGKKQGKEGDGVVEEKKEQ